MHVSLCHFRKGHLEVVKILVNNSNLNVNATDSYGDTPLDDARRYVYTGQLVLPYTLVSVFSGLLHHEYKATLSAEVHECL